MKKKYVKYQLIELAISFFNVCKLSCIHLKFLPLVLLFSFYVLGGGVKYYLIGERVIFHPESYALKVLSKDAPLTEGRKIKLSSLETATLEYLCTHEGDITPRLEILKNIWPNDTGSDGHLNRVILLLRRKFESIGMPDIINTVPRVGYGISNVTAVNEDIDVGNKTLVNISVKRKIYFLVLAVIIAILSIIIILIPLLKMKSAIRTYSVKNTTVVYDASETPSSLPIDLFESQKRDGQYYIGIFGNAISITYVDAEMTSAIRKIFLRDKSSATKEDLFNQLKCVINDVNDSTPLPIHRTKEEHGTTKKKFEYEINYDCPTPPSARISWHVNIMYSNDSYKPYFLADSSLLNKQNTLLYRAIFHGVINNHDNNTRAELENSTSSVVYSEISDDSDIAPVFQLVSEFNKSGYTTEFIKLNRSIYHMSFMGGVVLLIQ